MPVPGSSLYASATPFSNFPTGRIGETPLQVIANDYASHGLGVYPALPQSKEPAGSWKAFQWAAPSDVEREALFSLRCNLNIGVICGAASSNLAALDCETPKAFEDQVRRVKRAGYSETWTVKTNRGGHIYLFLPVPVKPVGKINDVEVRAQGQFLLLPPSQHPAGPHYKFLNRTPEIARVGSLRELDWLRLEETPTTNCTARLPRKALQLLRGDMSGKYATRSEAEQAIVTILVNASFTFEQVLSLFRTYPAAGKFHEIEDREGLDRALRWLRICFAEARRFCLTESPARLFARNRLDWAYETPWPGRTGSTDRAIYCAHATLAYRSGKHDYHASSRDLAEIAGCARRSASKSTERLRQEGLIQLTSIANALYANRYTLNHADARVSERAPLTTTPCERVGQTSSFCLPDAFRNGGLGKPAYEVITALNGGSMTVPQLAKKTGRHAQTVRAALKKMLPFGMVEKRGWLWQGCPIRAIEALTESVGMKGARKRQQQKHQSERLRRNVSRAVTHHWRSLGIE